LENFGGEHCENTTTVYDIPAQDFAATTDFWGTYSDGLFIGDCNSLLATARADFTDLLQENDRIETISCAYDMDGPSDPLPEDTVVLVMSTFSHFYGNSVETLGQGWGTISEGQAWALRINQMPHDVGLDNNDSYVIDARQRVMGDDTTCIEEYALEGCNVTVSGEPVHMLELAEGWNIISTFINTQNRDFVDVVTPIREQMMIAKNYLGQAFMPEWDYNAIGNWQPGQGYQTKVVEAVTLNIHGPIIQPEHTPVTLYEGWNMIGYLRMNPADLQEIMVQIVDQVIIAKNNNGNAYLATYDFNGIGNMVPGQGYQIKVNENVDLVYNANHHLYPSEGE
jgi:hypothetical protein